MLCIYCSHATGVTNSRLKRRTNTVWRRRHCPDCLAVFTTIEQPELSLAVMVRDQKGHLVPFRREKLLQSLLGVLSHRSSRFDDAEQLCRTITAQLLSSHRAQMDSGDILAAAAKTLKNFNHQAYVRYIAEYDSASARISRKTA